MRQHILSRHKRLYRVRNALLLSLMHQTGMRPSEARGMRLRDIDFGAGVVDMPAEVSKTKRRRLIPLWTPLAEDLREWRKLAELWRADLICGKPDGEPMTMNDWENWRERIYEKARNHVANAYEDSPARLEEATAYDVCRHSHAKAAHRAAPAGI